MVISTVVGPLSSYAAEWIGSAASVLTVLCVVPRQLAEGEEISIPQPVLDLQIGQPVLFPLFTSTVRGDDKAGDVLHLPPGQLRPLPLEVGDHPCEVLAHPAVERRVVARVQRLHRSVLL